MRRRFSLRRQFDLYRSLPFLKLNPLHILQTLVFERESCTDIAELFILDSEPFSTFPAKG
jgi:hypothetical protein